MRGARLSAFGLLAACAALGGCAPDLTGRYVDSAATCEEGLFSAMMDLDAPERARCAGTGAATLSIREGASDRPEVSFRFEHADDRLQCSGAAVREGPGGLEVLTVRLECRNEGCDASAPAYPSAVMRLQQTATGFLVRSFELGIDRYGAPCDHTTAGTLLAVSAMHLDRARRH